MAKKAFLVSFCPQTRVVVDVPDDYDGNFYTPTASEIIKAAREKIMSAPEDYLFGDNCDDITEDLECPFGTLSEDK